MNSIARFWDEAMVPALVEHIRVPAKSPHFDPQWTQHGHIARGRARRRVGFAPDEPCGVDQDEEIPGLPRLAVVVDPARHVCEEARAGEHAREQFDRHRQARDIVPAEGQQKARERGSRVGGGAPSLDRLRARRCTGPRGLQRRSFRFRLPCRTIAGGFAHHLRFTPNSRTGRHSERADAPVGADHRWNGCTAGAVWGSISCSTYSMLSYDLPFSKGGT
jgi:hypothetical protein